MLNMVRKEKAKQFKYDVTKLNGEIIYYSLLHIRAYNQSY
jgi:hypothetical protein